MTTISTPTRGTIEQRIVSQWANEKIGIALLETHRPHNNYPPAIKAAILAEAAYRLAGGQ